MARSEEHVPSARRGREGEHAATREAWSRRRNRLYVRNGEMLVILLVALIAGAAATVLTAFLGVR
ncbi:MAG TPA: hypothetical protein VNA87_05575 [Actinomycetota bacterium]|nr:hypothetical protein [Actinomycetota bacterium]